MINPKQGIQHPELLQVECKLCEFIWAQQGNAAKRQGLQSTTLHTSIPARFILDQKGFKSNSIRVSQCGAHVPAHTATKGERDGESESNEILSTCRWLRPLWQPVGNGQLHYAGHVLQVLEFHTCQKSHKWHIILIRSQTLYR